MDSDNDSGYEPDPHVPGDAEDLIEDDASKPGKIVAVAVADGDSDADGVPDYADGYVGLGTAGTLSPAGATGKWSVGSQKFVPVVLTVPDGVNLSQAKFKLTYDANDPLDVVHGVVPPSASNPIWSLGDVGSLRLWKNQNLARVGDGRDIAHPSGKGELIKSETSYTASQLGFSTTSRTVTLWVQAVRALDAATQTLIWLAFENLGDPDWTVADKVALGPAVAFVSPANGQKGVTGDEVTSTKGPTGLKHYVSPKDASGSVILQTDVHPIALAWGQDIEWRINGAAVAGVAGHPEQVAVPRSTPGRFEVAVFDKKNNVSLGETLVWIVWANGGKAPDSPQPQVGVGHGAQMPAPGDRHNPPQQGPGSYAAMNAPWVFQFDILPKAILTDSDRPNFDQPPAQVIEGTHDLFGAPLAGGVRARWDVSRRWRAKAFSPNTGPEWYDGSVPGAIFGGSIANGDVKEDYPTEDWVGNDDSKRPFQNLRGRR